MRAGVAAAPFVITWHACPLSHEHEPAQRPEHTEQHTYHPLNTHVIEMFTSALSTSRDLAVRVDPEQLRMIG